MYVCIYGCKMYIFVFPEYCDQHSDVCLYVQHKKKGGVYVVNMTDAVATDKSDVSFSHHLADIGLVDTQPKSALYAELHNTEEGRS